MEMPSNVCIVDLSAHRASPEVRRLPQLLFLRQRSMPAYPTRIQRCLMTYMKPSRTKNASGIMFGRPAATHAFGYFGLLVSGSNCE